MCRVPPFLLAFFAMLAFLLGAGEARAQASDPATSSIDLVQPLSVTKLDDLDFGTAIVTGAGDVTITVDPNALPGADVSSTGPVLVREASAARFGGSTVKKTGVIVRVPKADILVTRVGGSEQLTVRDFSLEGDPRKQFAAGTAFDFRVGATIDIPDGTVPGQYEGTFAVEIQYP